MLWLIPGVFLFYIWSFKRKQNLINRFVIKELRDRLLSGVSVTRQKIKALLLVGVIVFIVLSLIRPQWGFKWEEIKRKGVDIIVALDVSSSMLAEDVSPNRLERAKREIIDLLNILQGDRVGLIAFAGASFLQTPLTLDYGAVKIFLDDLSTDLIPIPGTAIGEAIQTSIKSFDQKDKKSRVLILITDGEDHQGSPIKIAKDASKHNIKIYTIGIGKEGGAPIPDRKIGGFKKDRSGELIITHLDEETLQKIALETGGSYVRSITGDLDLEKIYENIVKNVEEKELKSGKRKRFEERFQWILIIAVFLMFIETIFPERRRKRKKESKALNINLILFIGIFSYLFTQDLYAGTFDGEKSGEEYFNEGDYGNALKHFLDLQIDDPNNYKLKYNLGNTYYKMKSFEEAEKLFQTVSMYGEKRLAAKAYYNLGNVAAALGKLQDAVEYYKKALELNPDDLDAKNNIEIIREEIKRRIEENKKRQKDKKEQGKDKKEQGKDKKDQDKDKKDQDKDKKDQDKDQKDQDKDQKDQDKDPKEQDKDQKEQGKDQKEQDKDQKEQGKDKKEAQTGKNIKKDDKMSKDEADQWLSTLEEDRKKYLKKRIKNRGRYNVEKDW